MTDWTDFDAMDPVTGPLDLLIWFVAKDTAPPAQSTSLSGTAGALARGQLLNSQTASDPGSGNTADLDAILSTGLPAYFDTTWQKQIDSVKTMMVQQILAQAPDAKKFSYTITDHGELHGAVGDLSPELKQKFPPGAEARQLTLIYKLVGIAMKFQSKDLDLILKIWIKLTYEIGFPKQTSLGIQMIVKQQVNPWVEGANAASDFAFDIATFLGLASQPSTSSNLSLSGLLGSLNAGFELALQFGFTETDLSGISVPDPNFHGPSGPPSNPSGGSTPFTTPTTPPSGKLLVVHIDLRHPLDPAPAFFDPPPPSLSPLFQLDRQDAYPGDSVGIFGSNWPYTPFDEFIFHFSQSTSGTWKQTDVESGIIPAGQSAVTNITATTFAHLWPTVRDDMFRISPLPPNTHVACRIREYDLPDFICTKWTGWKDGWTSTEFAAQVLFFLKLHNGTLLPLTTTIIDVNAGGGISGNIDLPGSISPGIYDIVAQMPAQETATFSTPITIDDQAAAPRIQLMNLFNQPNGSVIAPANLLPATQYLRGYHFKPNILMLLSLNSVGGEGLQQLTPDMTGTVAHPGALTDAKGDFFTTFEWPSNHVGAFRLFVVEDVLGGRSLSLPVNGE